MTKKKGHQQRKEQPQEQSQEEPQETPIKQPPHSLTSKAAVEVTAEHGYRFVEKLGQGTFGKVVSAIKDSEGEGKGTKYAVKVISRRRLGSRLSKEQAAAKIDQTEVKVMRLIKHANVCQFLDLFSDKEGNYFFIVLELLDGGSLYDYLCDYFYDASFTFKQKKWFSLQILFGLIAIHGKGYAHSDLKPENVMVSAKMDDHQRGPVLKLIDFGLSTKGIDEEKGVYLSKCLGVAGSQGYKPSEMYVLAKYYLGHCGPCADGFSFGIIGWLLMTYEHPLLTNAQWGDLYDKGREFSTIMLKCRVKDPVKDPPGEWTDEERAFLAFLKKFVTNNPLSRLAVEVAPTDPCFADVIKPNEYKYEAPENGLKRCMPVHQELRQISPDEVKKMIKKAVKAVKKAPETPEDAAEPGPDDKERKKEDAALQKEMPPDATVYDPCSLERRANTVTCGKITLQEVVRLAKQACQEQGLKLEAERGYVFDYWTSEKVRTNEVRTEVQVKIGFTKTDPQETAATFIRIAQPRGSTVQKDLKAHFNDLIDAHSSIPQPLPSPEAVDASAKNPRKAQRKVQFAESPAWQHGLFGDKNAEGEKEGFDGVGEMDESLASVPGPSVRHGAKAPRIPSSSSPVSFPKSRVGHVHSEVDAGDRLVQDLPRDSAFDRMGDLNLGLPEIGASSLATVKQPQDQLFDEQTTPQRKPRRGNKARDRSSPMFVADSPQRIDRPPLRANQKQDVAGASAHGNSSLSSDDDFDLSQAIEDIDLNFAVAESVDSRPPSPADGKLSAACASGLQRPVVVLQRIPDLSHSVAVNDGTSQELRNSSNTNVGSTQDTHTNGAARVRESSLTQTPVDMPESRASVGRSPSGRTRSASGASARGTPSSAVAAESASQRQVLGSAAEFNLHSVKVDIAGETKYRCRHCGKPFANPDAVMKHARMKHSGCVTARKGPPDCGCRPPKDVYGVCTQYD